MNEAFLSYVWQYRLYPANAMLWDGTPFSVESPGVINSDAGPDFLGARIRIGNTLWVGNVEIHVKSSDWYLHRHQDDRAFDTVILHVVFQNDTSVLMPDNTALPVFQLKGSLDPGLYTRYLQWMASPGEIPCKPLLLQNRLTLPSQWLISLGVQRLMRKSQELAYLFQRLGSDWREICYVSLCKSFGNKVNDDIFEMLALKTPLQLVQKHLDDPLDTEALFFGQSGLLDQHADLDHPYVHDLLKRWNHLRYAYQTSPVEPHLWRFLRTRPANFPTIRIAQLAATIKSFMAINPFDAKTIMEWHKSIPNTIMSEYWTRHFHFGKKCRKLPRKIGSETGDKLLINGLLPPLLRYGELYNKHDFISDLIDLAASLPEEKNRITRQWAEVSVQPESALESQGLTELFNGYCRARRCLECRYGQQLLKS